MPTTRTILNLLKSERAGLRLSIRYARDDPENHINSILLQDHLDTIRRHQDTLVEIRRRQLLARATTRLRDAWGAWLTGDNADYDELYYAICDMTSAADRITKES